MTHHRISTLLLLILMLHGTSPAWAEDRTHQSHDSIHQAVRDHINRLHSNHQPAPVIKINPLDRRLKLDSCHEGIETYEPPGFRSLGRTTVGVRCREKTRWSLFVPAHVTIEVNALVATRDISRGETLAPSDVGFTLLNSTKLLRGYLDKNQQAIGKKARRNIKRNTPLIATMLSTPKAVKRGSQITLLSRIGAIVVRAKGKAMGDGGIGDPIEVLNPRSKRRIQGYILSPGVVEIR